MGLRVALPIKMVKWSVGAKVERICWVTLEYEEFINLDDSVLSEKSRRIATSFPAEVVEL